MVKPVSLRWAGPTLPDTFLETFHDIETPMNSKSEHPHHLFLVGCLQIVRNTYDGPSIMAVSAPVGWIVFRTGAAPNTGGGCDLWISPPKINLVPMNGYRA